MSYQRFQVAGFELFACQGLFDRRQLQDHTQHPGHGTVAPQDLVIENQVLQFAAFDGHDDCPVCAVQWRQHSLRARLQGQAIVLVTAAYADATTEAKVLVQPGDLHLGLFRIVG